MSITWLKKISVGTKHNAFTDLCQFKSDLYCCFREASNHVSKDGKIKIQTLDLAGNVTRTIAIQLPNTDLRDPKLSITADGQLMLIAYARLTDDENRTLSSRNLCWVSQTGHSWSSYNEFGNKGWWLWRLTWHQNLAYGFAYNRAQNAINLYQGNPKRGFYLHKSSALSLKKHGKGYPNESEIQFIGDKAYAIVRRDADSYSAQLGESKAPYTQWSWLDLNAYIGGPAMLLINQNKALVAGRIVQNKKLVTGLMILDLVTGQLKLKTVLPSGGDNSYPGLQKVGDNLYISYYSSHQDQKACIYLAKIDLQGLLKRK